MTGFQVWTSRLRARFRKWWRDPAAFSDELPSAVLRAAALFSLAGGTVLSDALSRSDRRAARAWKRSLVSLVRDGEGSAYRFLTADGNSPEDWPSRAMLHAENVAAVVVVFGENNELITAAEVDSGRPGLVSLGSRPVWARIYRTDDRPDLPDRMEVRPMSRAEVVRVWRARGLSMAQCLRLVWPPFERRPTEPTTKAYARWIAENEPGPDDGPAITAWLSGLGSLPEISVLMPVHDPKPDHLRAAIRSVTSQIYDGWRLCLADDASKDEEVRSILRIAAEDFRVRLVRLETSQGVAAATNAALALAKGDAAVFLDHDDVLAPHALAFIAAAFAGRPDAVAVYADEDRIDALGARASPAFKGDFDAKRLLGQNYINHPFAVRLDILRRLGGLRLGLDGVQDHDLVLRVAADGTGPILHLPHVLYHWRSYPGGASLSQKTKIAVDEARVRLLHEHAPTAIAQRVGSGGHLLVGRAMPASAPKVLAIIPTRDRPGLLEACVAGFLDQTDYPALELCIVDNGSRTEEALRLLARLDRMPRVRVMRIDAPFNFSALNNAAAATAQADVLAFVNDDILVVEPDWLGAMTTLSIEPEVGAVGAKLFYPDGRLQHAGIVLGLGPHRIAGHEFRGAPGDLPGPQNRLMLLREASAVTAACMVVEKRKFDEVGGFDARSFPVAFNDVDLCLRLKSKGYATLWTPQARLIHLESATRGSDSAGEARGRLAGETARMRARWGSMLRADPAYNPNLTLEDESYTLAERSRADAPWR